MQNTQQPDVSNGTTGWESQEIEPVPRGTARELGLQKPSQSYAGLRRTSHVGKYVQQKDEERPWEGPDQGEW